MSGELPQQWDVELEIDGRRDERTVTIFPPFGIRCADAEVKAIKEAEAAGGKKVRCTRSRFLRILRPLPDRIEMPK